MNQNADSRRSQTDGAKISPKLNNDAGLRTSDASGMNAAISRRVVHCKREPFDVYIGRPSKWGNPFVIGKYGDREEVLAKYRAWLMTQPHLLRLLPELKGKVLGCWCAPKSCHGDILAEFANAPQKESA